MDARSGKYSSLFQGHFIFFAVFVKGILMSIRGATMFTGLYQKFTEWSLSYGPASRFPKLLLVNTQFCDRFPSYRGDNKCRVYLQMSERWQPIFRGTSPFIQMRQGRRLLTTEKFVPDTSPPRPKYNIYCRIYTKHEKIYIKMSFLLSLQHREPYIRVINHIKQFESNFLRRDSAKPVRDPT